MNSFNSLLNIGKKYLLTQWRSARSKPSIKPRLAKEKRLDVVILGRPNAGKSELLNQLLKVKLAATSRKRQTTRNQILGVFNHENTQIAIYDTPGFVSHYEAGKSEIRQLRSSTLSALENADVVLLLVDAAKAMGDVETKTFCEMVKLALSGAKQETILVLNKVDLIHPKSKLLATTHGLVSLINGVKYGPQGADQANLDQTTFMISALKNDGVIDLKNYLYKIAKPKPWILEKSEGNTDLSEYERVEEILLEMLLSHTHEEIPYTVGIDCTSVEKIKHNKLRVDVNILVDNKRQQKIIIGYQGRTLVKLRQSAADILEKTFNKDILLFLWVKLRTKNTEESDQTNL